MKDKQQLVKDFQQAILTNYKENGRDLPWRHTKDPYRILVSELMLQQTQVDRVIPKYEAFLNRFPDAQSLAQATLGEVLTYWQGLGYNRRAKYLHQAAQTLSNNTNPSYKELLSLKGIGPYTAAAVCAFAYNQDHHAVDVNIERVFRRFFGYTDHISKSVPENKSRDWHNALMDFGAVICTKKNPSCASCPLQSQCVAFKEQNFDQEKSFTQKKFVGSVRWHRGQILKSVLAGEQSEESIWNSLDTKHRNKDFFQTARSQLIDEGLILKEKELLVSP